LPVFGESVLDDVCDEDVPVNIVGMNFGMTELAATYCIAQTAKLVMISGKRHRPVYLHLVLKKWVHPVKAYF
jgi:hypothetical protein